MRNMEKAMYDLIEHARNDLSEDGKKALLELERVLDYNDDKYAVLTDIEMMYFKIGLKAGIGLVKAINIDDGMKGMC